MTDTPAELAIMPPAGLPQEITKLWASVPHMNSGEMLSLLNGPARVQMRGFALTSEHLLATIIHMHRADDNTRFFLYDEATGQIHSKTVYDNDSVVAAVNDQIQARKDGSPGVVIRRFDLGEQLDV